MGRRVSIALLGAASAALALGLTAQAPAAGGGPPVPDINWTRLLPPVNSPNEPQPGPVPHCRVSSPACVDTEVKRMTRLRDQLGCDHRAVFDTTYLTLTKVFRRTLHSEHLYAHPHYLYTEDALFADFYFDTVHAWQRGGTVPPAWRIAFKTAASGDANGAQDMLLGINAHVQNDMPFVVAALGLRTRSGESRKPDHDAVNNVLHKAYKPVVHAIRDHYDKLVGVTNSDATPLDDFAGLNLVRGWREKVWREAERLDNAKTAAQRRQVAHEIHQYAGATAQAIADANLTLPPNYRQTRDAYCAAHPFK
jgi:Family of unknown function (DUF5995)